jgi:glycosyltransferase involved in cell wall biosynthesis
MTICLDPKHSTTRMLTNTKPESAITTEQRAGTVLFLPHRPDRKGEGGLRKAGYFKTGSDAHPLLSVITVVFNGGAHLEQTILSVTEQNYDNIEYIIIDGGSSDSTLDIIKKYEDRIDYWVSESDRGLYDAMNKAIDASSGTWLNFLNCGDLYAAKQVVSQALLCRSHNTDAIYSDHYRYSPNSTAVKRVKCDSGNLYFSHQSIVYRRSLHQTHGSYVVNGGLSISDYLFFSLIKKDAFRKSPHPISNNLEGGISDHRKHIRQKLAVDFLLNRAGFLSLAYSLTLDLLNRNVLAILSAIKR